MRRFQILSLPSAILITSSIAYGATQNSPLRSVVASGKLKLEKNAILLVVAEKTSNELSLRVDPPTKKNDIERWVGSFPALINRTVKIKGLYDAKKFVLYAESIDGAVYNPMLPGGGTEIVPL